MKTIKLFVMAFALLAFSLYTAAQVTTAQIREQIAKGECETAQSLYNVYKAMNGANKTIEREIAECKSKGNSNFGDDLTFTVNGVSFTMKPVEGGTFWMGAQNTNPRGINYDSEASDDASVHRETVGSFYMGETEVTQALWEAVMGTTIRQQRDKQDPSEPLCGEGADYPMYYVSRDEWLVFIQELNRLTGNDFRLPTEVEWEYAARGGNLSSSAKYAGSYSIEKVAWYADNSNDKAHLVKSKSPNELGLYDMSGNVQEYYQETEIFPCFRGGSWDSEKKFCCVWARCYSASFRIVNGIFYDTVNKNTGLRLCFSW